MFVYDLWHPQSAASLASVFKHHMPLMLMSYLGALKSWLYAPILFFFEPSKSVLRVPTLLLAIGTIATGGIIVSRISGKAAGILLIWLLATDVTFLFTAVFDWGPVVLQNLLLVGGIFFVAEWWRWRERSTQNEFSENPKDAGNWMLFAGSLIFGLALWDKALFVWNLSAMIVAVAILNPRGVMRTLRFKPLVLIALGLTVGAYPLIRFNVSSNRSTLGENAHLTLRDLAPKGKYLKLALDGVEAEAAWSDSSIIAQKGLHPPTVVPSWRSYFFLFVIPLGLIVAAPRMRRWIAFFLLSAGIAWFQAAITLNAGGSIHHTVLIWPLVYAAVALSIAAIAEAGNRWVAITAFAATAIICIRGMETLYLSQKNITSYSHIVQWTDADTSLSEQLKNAGVKRVIAVDWGIGSVVAADTADRISVIDETFELADGRFDKNRFLGCTDPDCRVIAHAPGRELFQRSAAFLQESMRSLHLDKAQASTVSDTHGVPAFLVYRIKK